MNFLFRSRNRGLLHLTLRVVAAVTRGEVGVGNGRTPVEPARKVGRRGSLPNGRSVVGGFLVAVAVLGVFAAYQDAQIGPVHRYVTVSRDVTAGTVLAAGDLELTAVDLPKVLSGRTFDQMQPLVGRIAVVPLARGELVQVSAVADRAAADPRYQLSVPLEKGRALDGALVPGETVDVLVTYTGAGLGTGGTFVVARRAEVIRVDSGRSGTLSTTAGDIIVVLAVEVPDDVLAITHGSQAGKVTLVRATGAASSLNSNSYQAPSDGG